MIGPNGAGKTTFFKMLTCEIPPTSGTIIFEGRDITGMTVTDVCQLGLTKSYQVNQLFTRSDRPRELDDRGVGRIAWQVPSRHAAQPVGNCRARGAGRADARAGRISWSVADTPVSRTCLWREAAARDRSRAGDQSTPAAARRAARRHEPARARGDREAAQIDQPRPHA